jgi:hypothetical protein
MTESDIVEQLRDDGSWEGFEDQLRILMREAADEIERLRARLAEHEKIRLIPPWRIR